MLDFLATLQPAYNARESNMRTRTPDYQIKRAQLITNIQIRICLSQLQLPTTVSTAQTYLLHDILYYPSSRQAAGPTMILRAINSQVLIARCQK